MKAASIIESILCRAAVILDAIVTVVDARNILDQLSRASAVDGSMSANEAQQQVAYADVLLLNKTDLVDETQIAKIRKTVLRHNAAVQIVPCIRCEIDLSTVLERRCYQDGVLGQDVLLGVENAASASHSCAEDPSSDVHYSLDQYVLFK